MSSSLAWMRSSLEWMRSANAEIATVLGLNPASFDEVMLNAVHRRKKSKKIPLFKALT